MVMKPPPPSHIYSTPIDVRDVMLRKLERFNNDGNWPNPFLDYRNHGVWSGVYREIEMRAYLDGTQYPNLYPEPDLMSSDKTSANYNYWTWRQEATGQDPRLNLPPLNAYKAVRDWLMPIEHPERPWQYSSVDGSDVTGRYGRSISNEIPQPGRRRQAWTPLYYDLWVRGDWVFPGYKQPRQYFPIVGDMVYPDPAVFPMDTTWVNEAEGRRIYDHPILKEINPETGVQDNTDDYNYEKVIDFAPAFFALSGSVGGGSDHLGAIHKAYKGCQKHKAIYGANEPCALSLVTDGAPNLAVDSGTQNITPWTKDPLPFDVMMPLIEDEIDKFEDLGNTLIMILFIQHSPPGMEANTFLDLFRCATPPCAWKGTRVLLTFSYTTADDYRAKLMDAMMTETALLKAQSKLVDDSNA
ncbi:hypothetical protein OAO01_01495 [Oligoflexia bacterium]|nr:hypothetical protein [Oligoflexia bacterium]